MATPSSVIYDASNNVISSSDLVNALHQAGYGTTGQVFASNGPNVKPTFQTAPSGASGTWTLISSVTAANSATVDFANLLTSTYKIYMVEMYGGKHATDVVRPTAIFGTGATPTWQQGAGAYSWTSISNTTSTGNSDAYMGMIDGTLPSSGAGSSMDLQLFIPNPADTTYFCKIYGNWYGSNTYIASNFIGAYKTTGAVTSIRFLNTSGNLLTGVYRLWGFVGA